MKPLQPICQAPAADWGRVQVESKFKPLQVTWQSLPKAIPEENQALTAKSMAQLLGRQWGSDQALLGLI